MIKKVPLKVENFAGGLRILARFLLTSDNPKIFSPIEAIVDTGSPKTIIGPIDIKKMRLSNLKCEGIEGKDQSLKLGGGEVKTRILSNARIRFGKEIDITMPINIPIDSKEQNTPSILGVDFLLATKAKLFFDAAKKESFFELEEPI